jgi:LPS export ABC transporter permease LptG/LPS export ABC transporter permease LptF
VRILDRYVIRQTFWPAVLGLMVFTFLLIIPTVLRSTEDLVAKGVPATVIATLMLTLLPSALGLAIPMALLLGLLVGFGRLSSDREWVAMQACGVSLARLLWPVGVLAGAATAATLYVLLAALPQANQAFREIMFRILSERAEGEVRPRVFFDAFPGATLYVRELPPTGGWKDVFLVTGGQGQPEAVHVAKRGRVLIDRAQRRVEIVLEEGVTHTVGEADNYRPTTWRQTILSVDPETIFPKAGPAKGEREMSIAELRTRIADRASRGESTIGARVEIQKKFSIPAACLVLGLFGLALGASHRREGKLSSFVIGVVVIYAYYALLENSSNLAKGGYLPPWIAAWLPNLVFGFGGIVLFLRRRASIERTRRGPGWWTTVVARLPRRNPNRQATAGTAFRLPALPGTRLLDRYVFAGYARVFLLCAAALVGLFHVSTFIDLSDEVLRGDANWGQLFWHLWFATPQALYYVLPMSVLLATLVTVGLLTRNSELIVMKACGISLYRISLPLFLAAASVAAAEGWMQETLLGPANYRAEAIRHVIRGGSPETFDVLRRRWVAARNGEIYHFGYFDPRTRTLVDLDTYRIDYATGALASRAHAARAAFSDARGAWLATDGWRRGFTGETVTLAPITEELIDIEAPSYFSMQTPDPDFMNYVELTDHIGRLERGGFDMTRQRVALERKLAFPLATLIMALIGIPFATTTGNRGAMYGIGVGLVLAFSYWGALSVFGAMGAATLMTPLLAAWAPNLLFSSGAAWLLLTVRT